jgi:hypothetical protein
MKTTINNNLRVYHIVAANGQQVFCNIEDINKAVKNLQLKKGFFKIYNFWNNKPERCTRAMLDGFFEGAELKREFEY